MCSIQNHHNAPFFMLFDEMRGVLFLLPALVSIGSSFSNTPLFGSRHCTKTCTASGSRLIDSPFLAHRRRHQRHCNASSWSRSCASATMPQSSAAGDGTSTAWPPADRLGEYVTESSLVDYRRLATEEKEWLAGVVSSMKSTDHREMAASDRHAFLINAYNLWTLHWVVRERRSVLGWKGAVSVLAKVRFFYCRNVSTAGGKWNLYNFENKIIRPEVNDARVHFALNCASISCPPLRRTLFTGAALDAELNEVTSAAINGGAMVQLSSDRTLRVNPIFKWYKEDFDKEGGILAFIRKHWNGAPLPEEATLDFFEYDWRSNNADAAWADRALGGPAP